MPPISMIGKIKHNATLCSSTKTSNDYERILIEKESIDFVGFIFYPTNNPDANRNKNKEVVHDNDDFVSSQANFYPLIIPSSVSRIACHAAQTSKDVCIKKYSLISIPRKNKTSVVVLAVSCHGMDTIPTSFHTCATHYDYKNIKTKRNYDKKEFTDAQNVSTLSTFREFEQHQLTQKSDASNNKNSSSLIKNCQTRSLYSIKATIDAVSPIISSPGDPFALIELYQKNTANTCVAVLKGNDALQCIYACLPGDDILLKNVKRQKWHVPKSFMKQGMTELSKRTPTYVFVITKASSIQFRYECVSPDENSSSTTLKRSLSSPCYSKTVFCPRYSNNIDRFGTVYPLQSIRAKISNIISHHFILGKDIYQIEVMPPQNTCIRMQNEFFLFLTNFPMTMNLSAGLRVGTHIHAMNLHVIYPWGDHPSSSTKEIDSSHSDQFLENKNEYEHEKLGFAACCRSTITIIHVGDAERISELTPENISETEPQQNCNTCNFNFSKKYNNKSIVSNDSKRYFSWNHLLSKTYLSNIKNNISISVWKWSVYKWSIDSGIETLLKLENRNKKLDTISEQILAFYLDQKTTFSTKTKQKEFRSGLVENNINKNTRLRRDLYAEFFDHGIDNNLLRKSPKLIGCTGIYSSSTKPLPIIIGLSHIRNCCVKYLKRKLRQIRVNFKSNGFDCNENSFTNQKFCASWSGSDILSMKKLCRLLFPKEVMTSSKVDRIFTAGITQNKWDSYSNKYRLIAIQDANCRLPVTGTLKNQHGTLFETTSCKHDQQSGDLLLISMNMATVSFLCLGDVQTSSTKDDDVFFSLPSASNVTEENRDVIRLSDGGSCVLFCVDNIMFIASVHLHCNKYTIVSKVASKVDFNFPREMFHLQPEEQGYEEEKKSDLQPGCEKSIFDVLQNSRDENNHVIGKLLRHRFRFNKVKNNIYMGFSMTISHLPFENGEVHLDYISNVNISTAQSLDIKIPIFVSTRMKRVVREIICTKMLNRSSFLDEDRIAIASVWWEIAEGHNHSNCLLYGGLDEQHYLNENRLSSNIFIPLLHGETSKNGYKRWKCELIDLMAFCCVDDILFDHKKEVKTLSKDNSELRFDMEGGKKFLSGMLDNRTKRKTFGNFPSQIVKGEMCLYSSPVLSGIPETTIEDLYFKLCEDLQKGEAQNLTPSLVRCITGARLLYIGFCQARVQCTKCFEYLISNQGCSALQYNNSTLSRTTSNINMQKNTGTQEISYWHLPLALPDDIDTNNIDIKLQNDSIDYDNSKFGKRRDTPKISAVQSFKDSVHSLFKNNSALRCPSQCSLNFASVKWECSGVLNGNGQAKLFAERDVAKLLLGNNLDIETIERGAWANEKGIIFNRSMPPSAYLKNALNEAKVMALDSLGRWDGQKQGKRRKKDFRPLDFLSIEAKAEYLLYKHCRDSTEPSRCLNFLCRCKPVVSNIRECIKRSEVEVVENTEFAIQKGTSFRRVSTFALPPVVLNLVDCCATDTYSDVGMDLLRSF